MVQFNLLPDVKQQYIKAVYRRRLVTVSCFIVGAVFLAIFIFMFLFVRFNQKSHISHLDQDITKGVSELKSNQDLDKILTIQNQLSALPALHNQKIMTSRLFEYLGQLTPAAATVSDLDLNVETKTITIEGSAADLATINKFVDTIKFTDYKLTGTEESNDKEGKAFSDVVLKGYSISTGQGSVQGASVTYEITFVYDETIFINTAVDGSAIANSVKLTVPKIITTRSETQKPSDLFQASPNSSQGDGNEQ